MKYLLEESDAETLCHTVADIIVKAAAKAIKKRNQFTIVLSGGSTPKLLYQLLATELYTGSIDWSKTFVFWGDERYLSATDENNNSNMARQALLKHVPIPEKNIFAVPVELEPLEAAKTYEKSIVDFFGKEKIKFDICLLGIGENGHTASLFPHTAILKEKKKLVTAFYIEEVHMFRISFTIPLLLKARKIMFLVTGSSKAEMLDQVLFGEYNPDEIPAQLIKGKKKKIFFCYDEAAGKFIAESMNISK